MIYKFEYLDASKVNIFHMTNDEFDSSMELEKTIIDLEENSNYSIGIYSTQYIDFLVKLMAVHKIAYKITNITAECTHTEVVFERFIEANLKLSKEIEEYMFANISLNDVLDKISEFGIESLNRIDKKNLENR